MKRQILIISSLVMLFAFHSQAGAQMLWRSAKTLSAGSFIAMTSGSLMRYNRSYNWASESWSDFGEGRSMSTNGIETMLGFGVTDRIEAMVHLPVLFLKNEIGGTKSSSSGLGDIYVKTRIGLIPWSKDKHGFTLVGAVRFGSGDTGAAPALGDGSTDFAVGGIFTTKWMGTWRGHLKFNAWLNGKTDAGINTGDDVQLITKIDHNFSAKMMGFISYIYYGQGKQKNASGDAVENSQKSRHYGTLGVLVKPLKNVFIRPKMTVPIDGKGGSLFAVKPLLEAWFIFELI